MIHAVAIEHGSLRSPGANVSAADLAPDQLAAVTHRGGGARIIAPAGSGKTRVLTERARHLLPHWNLPPSAVSLVAFNKRAQEEMRERTTDLPGLQVRTLNAIALAIVNGTPPFAPQPKSLAHHRRARRAAASSAISCRSPAAATAIPSRRGSRRSAVIRLGLVDPAEVEGRYDGDVDGLAEMWPSYRAALERRSSVDFDDQIYRALLVLLRDPAARRAAQRACRIMLVDEFQDLTPAHLLLVRLLAVPGWRVFGVGDDDQTIYGYNGADPAWLIDFAELFPGCRGPSARGQLPLPGRDRRGRRPAAAPQLPPRRQGHSGLVHRRRRMVDRRWCRCRRRRSSRGPRRDRRRCPSGRGGRPEQGQRPLRPFRWPW